MLERVAETIRERFVLRFGISEVILSKIQIEPFFLVKVLYSIADAVKVKVNVFDESTF